MSSLLSFRATVLGKEEATPSPVLLFQQTAHWTSAHSHSSTRVYLPESKSQKTRWLSVYASLNPAGEDQLHQQLQPEATTHENHCFHWHHAAWLPAMTALNESGHSEEAAQMPKETEGKSRTLTYGQELHSLEVGHCENCKFPNALTTNTQIRLIVSLQLMI